MLSSLQTSLSHLSFGMSLSKNVDLLSDDGRDDSTVSTAHDRIHTYLVPGILHSIRVLMIVASGP